jgi:hypothetical protein
MLIIVFDARRVTNWQSHLYCSIDTIHIYDTVLACVLVD